MINYGVEVITEPADPELVGLPRLLTVEQVAKFLSVGHRTVWRMVKAGRLPQPVKLGRKIVRWRWEDLKKWAEELK